MTATEKIKIEVKELVEALAQQFGGIGGIPTKTNDMIFDNIAFNGFGTGAASRNWVGMNINDIPVLQDVPHTKSGIENALAKRKGKIYDRIMLEAEKVVIGWAEEAAAEESAKPKGEAYEDDLTDSDGSFFDVNIFSLTT